MRSREVPPIRSREKAGRDEIVQVGEFERQAIVYISRLTRTGAGHYVIKSVRSISTGAVMGPAFVPHRSNRQLSTPEGGRHTQPEVSKVISFKLIAPNTFTSLRTIYSARKYRSKTSTCQYIRLCSTVDLRNVHKNFITLIFHYVFPATKIPFDREPKNGERRKEDFRNLNPMSDDNFAVKILICEGTLYPCFCSYSSQTAATRIEPLMPV